MRIVALLLAIISSLALARFDQSLAEFRQSITENALMRPEEKAAFGKAYESYIRARNEGLDELLEILEDSSTDHKDQQRNFVARAEYLSSELTKYFQNELQSDKLSGAALSVLNGIMFREQRFIEALKGLRVAEQRDYIVEQRRRMVQITELLETKWKGLLDLDDQLDRQEQNETEELQKTIAEIIRKSAEARKNIHERLSRVASIISSAGDKVGKIDEATKLLPPVVSAMAEIAGGLSDIAKVYDDWVKLQDFTERRIQTHKNRLMGEQRGVLILFQEVRKDTDYFIKENGFDKAKERYSLAETDLNRLPDNYSGSGPKADAAEFGKLALELISKHLKASEDAFEVFVRKHRTKFFGPIAPELSDEFLEVQVWEKLASQQQKLDLDGHLRAWREDIDRVFVVSYSGLREDHRKWIQDQYDKDMKKIASKLSELERELTWDRFKSAFFDRVKLLGSYLK